MEPVYGPGAALPGRGACRGKKGPGWAENVLEDTELVILEMRRIPGGRCPGTHLRRVPGWGLVELRCGRPGGHDPVGRAGRCRSQVDGLDVRWKPGPQAVALYLSKLESIAKENPEVREPVRILRQRLLYGRGRCGELHRRRDGRRFRCRRRPLHEGRCRYASASERVDVRWWPRKLVTLRWVRRRVAAWKRREKRA